MSDPIHILHVDDEPDFAEMAAEFLEREDDSFTVETATRASEGLERLASDDFECIVSDYDMPGQNGIEFLETVREEYPDLPFILYTGKGSEEVASDAISADVTDYLQKESGTDQYTILANRIRNYVERTRAQREREAMRERMDLALEHTDSLIYEIDLDTGAVRRLGDFEQFFDVTSEDVPTWEDHLDKAVHPDDRDKFREFHQQLVEGERESGTLEYRTFPDGDSVRWIRDDVLVRDDEPRQAIGLARDITQRKEREQELREERAFIDQALNTLDDVFYVTDPDGELRRWNDRVREVTGYRDDEIAEKNVLEFFPEGEKESVIEAIEEVLATGQSTVEADLLTKAGDRIPYEFRGVRFTDESGEPTGVVGIGRDISNRKKREQALEQLHATTRDLMAATTKEEIVAIGSETAESVLGLPMNGIHLYDDDEHALVPVAWTEQSEILLDDIPPSIPIDDSLAGKAYKTGNPGLYSDVHEEDETLNPETPIRSELHLPLGDHGVFLAGSTTPDDFDASDAALAQVLAANIESALDRVEREEDLARQQSLLEAQQEAVLDGMLVIDEDRQIISYNDRFVEMWDIPEKIVKEGDDERAIEAALDGLAKPEEFQEKVEHLYDHPDERDKDEIQLKDGRIFDRYTTPLIGEDGTHYGRLWTFRDITEQKERMQEVERERNRFEALFETVPDPTVHVVFEGSDPVIQHVNNAFEDVFGYESQEARGESIDDLIVPGEKQDEATNINESVREDGLLQTEIERETVTGDRPFLFTAQTMELGDEADDRVEGVGTYVDLTEQKRRENELARQNERLDEFASVLSHDLRNPLNVATGRLELVQEACDSEHLDAIAGALDRMEALIEDTLTLARQGDQVSEFEPVDLGELATNCWRNVDTAGATLITDTEQAIKADRSRLQQVLENLFRNAVEHGGEDVEITVDDLDEVSGFYVADNGPGISTDDQNKVFEPGYSSSDTGTGFGLSIVEQIVEAHGWTIDIESSESGGARFEITGVEFAN